MKQDMDFTTIFDPISTTQDAREVVDSLEALSESLFRKDNESVEKKIETVLPFSLADRIKQYCKDNQLSLQDPTVLADFLEKLTKLLRAFPVITFYVACMPNEQYIQHLSGLVFGYCKEKVLLDIIVEKKLVGGAIIAWKGVYKDYSLRKRIDEVYKNKELRQAP